MQLDHLRGAALPDGPGIEQQSLVELATGRLRAEILSGALAPGDRIVEETIRRRYGISRAPLREALRLLAQQGLVEHLPRRGTRVCTWSPQDIRELFEIRHVLERHAVLSALPVRHAGGDPLTAVRTRLADMRAADRRGDRLRRAPGLSRRRRRPRRQPATGAGPRSRAAQAAAADGGEPAPRGRAALARPGPGTAAAILAALESDDPATVLTALDRHGETAFLPL